MIKAIVWHVLMVIWLVALGYGLWWVWPEKLVPTTDFIAGVLWVLMGACAWLMAFNYGRQRYWRR